MRYITIAAVTMTSGGYTNNRDEQTPQLFGRLTQFPRYTMPSTLN
ncbi:hypothetical protein [Methyloglobulus morosus]|nr:hypothetical protein [Methyloglobulus morosus]